MKCATMNYKSVPSGFMWTVFLLSSILTASAGTEASQGDLVPDDDRRNISGLQCDQNVVLEKEYVVLENGSLLLPQDNSMYDSVYYSIENGTAYVCADSEELTQLSTAESTAREFNFSQEFLSCGHILIENDEYRLLENGTLYIETYNRYYEPSDYYPHSQGMYVCAPNFVEMTVNVTNISMGETEKFGNTFVYMSYVGISISIVSLVMHLIVFSLVSEVRNLPGCCLASLSSSLLAAYLCFISASFAANEVQCANLGLCMYYFFLKSFFWMNAISFDVWRSFRVVMRNLRISSHRVPWRRFLLYSTYSWVTPAFLVVFAVFADSTDIIPEEYRPSFGRPRCWFSQRKALLVFFAVPLFVVMTLNAAFFLDSSYVISRATMKAPCVNEAVLRKRFFMFMRLALLMGLTWIVGIVAGYADLEFLWYIFVILNTLQGLFIFVVFSCSAKVRGFIMKIIDKDSKLRQGTSVRTISNVSAL